MPRHSIDLTGKRFGKLVVVKYHHPSQKGAFWLCLCDCGKEKVAWGNTLRKGETTSCGCLTRELLARPKPATQIDMTGKRYGRLVAIERDGSVELSFWKCVCDCGYIGTFHGQNLRSGYTKSCGCLHREIVATAGGASNTPEYETWWHMILRCHDEKQTGYRRYGGRGISVCDSWRNSFDAFFADMGPRPSDKHSIDRIDNDGNYEPSNCRWATKKEQSRNTRCNHHVTINGTTKTIAEWSEISGISWSGIYNRVKKGWPEHLLLSALGRRYGKNT